MVRMPRHRHAPGKAGARDRQILEPAPDEADHFVAAAARRHCVGIGFVKRQQPLLPRRQPEEVIFLLQPFDFGAGRRPSAIWAVDELAFVVESLVAHRIPPGKAAEIDFATARQFLPQGLDGARVARLGRADEFVLRDVQQPRDIAKPRRVAVGEFLRRDTGQSGGLRDLLTVFVGPGQELDPPPVEPHEPRQRVARHGRIGVTQMRRVVDVVDRRRDEVRPGGVHGSLQTPDMGRGRPRSSARRRRRF